MESEDGGAVVCEPGCLVLESDFLLSGALEFGDAEIMGLDRDTGEFIGNARIKEGRNDHWTATPVLVLRRRLWERVYDSASSRQACNIFNVEDRRAI